MALRHSEEPQRRLSPEEARAFLQVHAEREAALETPTAEDLAETLGLSPEETRSILHEARARVVVPEAEPTTSTGSAKAFAVALLVLALGLAAFLTMLKGPTVVSAPVPTTLPAQRIEMPPVSTPLRAENALPPGVRPPDGFQILVESPSSTFGVGGATINDGTDYGRLGPAEATAVRERLVASILDLIWAKIPESEWNDLHQLTLSIQVERGTWTKLVVPVAPLSPLEDNGPVQEKLRASIDEVVKAAWPQIVRPASL